MIDSNSLQENMKNIEERIQAACSKAGRERHEVTLVNVSKTNPIEVLKTGYNLGMRVFGENKVQELREKIPALPEDISWHMIGHLQRNKIKYIIGGVHCIHSVDSYRLAEAIQQEAVKNDRHMDILVQVNVVGETTKFGLDLQEVTRLVREISSLDRVHIKGLMTIAPFVENPEDNRMVFKAMKELSVDINQQNIDNVSMNELSMGMTNDFEVAIEEGATMIRIGTALFGARNYQK